MKIIERLIYSLNYMLSELNKTRIIGANNKIIKNGTLEGVSIRIDGNNNELVIGKNSILRYTEIIFKGNNNRFIIDERCDIQKNEIWIIGNNCTFLLGAITLLVHSDICVGEDNSNIKIGENCMIAAEIRTTDSHSILNNLGERVNPAADIIIEDNVWVCKGSMVLKGVRIGCGSMIGARSMVNKDIPPKSLAVGFPAKIIRNEIGWDKTLL